jgi:hypothetical protein
MAKANPSPTALELKQQVTSLRKALDAAMQYVDPKDRDWIESIAKGGT